MRPVALLLSLFLGAAVLGTDQAPKPRDPFADVRTYELPNGLHVVLSPNPQATKVYVQVSAEAGHNEEGPLETGVAHLVEHAIFRAEGHREGRELPSYADRLDREGAEVNGATGSDETIFYASLPSDRAAWLVDLFGQMFRRESFSTEVVQKAKREIDLEYDSPKHDQDDQQEEELATLLEADFGISHDHPSRMRLAASTRLLGVRQVESFFQRYYHPRNLTLYVVGGFAEEPIRKAIVAAFGQLSSGKREPRHEPLPKPHARPLIRSTLASYAPRTILGVKYWGVEAQDELVLRAYLDHLAIRLMRILRTENGQTYTVSPLYLADTRRFGMGVVTFESSAQAFRRNLSYVTDLIRHETQEKKLSDVDLHEARGLYFARMRGQESDIRTLRDLAEQYQTFRITYGVEGTPFSLFSRISDEEFRDRLAKLFRPEREIRITLEPPHFFHGEDIALYVLVFFLSVYLLRWAIRRPENERGPFRFYCRSRYALSTWGMIAIRLLAASLLWAVLCLPFFVLSDSSWVQRSYWTGEYLRSAYLVATGVFALFYALGQIPRAIAVAGNRFIVKSLGFSSRSFALSEIAEVKVCRFPVALTALHWRSALTHLSPFEPGVLIRLKDGSGYFLGFALPGVVARELIDLLPTTNKLPALVVPPPFREPGQRAG